MSKTAAKGRQSTLTNDLSHQNGVTYDESLAATIHTYVKLAGIVKFSHCFESVEWHITQLGVLMLYKAKLPPSF